MSTALLSAPRALPWQRPAWARLERLTRADRLPHALLLAGPDGVGKRRFAAALGAARVCARPGPDGACGGCRDCRLVAAASHPDLLQLDAEPGRALKIDQVRTLSDFVALRSHAGRLRVVTLIGAERLNINAANALLKTLEEPPAGCLLLLLSAAPGRLPATVRSRCQRLALNLPARGVGLDWLRAELGTRFNATQADALLSLARGAPLNALALADAALLDRRRRLFEQFCAWLRADGSGVGGAPTPSAEDWAGGDPTVPLLWLTDWLGDLLKLTLRPGLPAELLRAADLAAELRPLATGLAPRRCLMLLDMARDLLQLSLSTQAAGINWELQWQAFFCLPVGPTAR